MINKRRFHRIQLSASAIVHHLEDHHEGVLGAISLGGAAINFTGSAMIPQGDDCTVSLTLDETLPPLNLRAKITNSSFYRVGVSFIDMDEESTGILYAMLKRLTHEPEKLENELHLIIALS